MEDLLNSGTNKLPLISLALVFIYATWREIHDPIGDELSSVCNQCISEARAIFQRNRAASTTHSFSHDETTSLRQSSSNPTSNDDADPGASQESLALEVYQVAFSFLSTHELNVCALVCFHWRNASRANEIWKPRVVHVLGEKYLGNAYADEILEKVFACTAQHETLVHCINVPRRLHRLDWKQFFALTRMLARSSGSGKSVVYDRGNVYPHQILQLAARIAAVKEPQNVVRILHRFVQTYADLGARRWNEMNGRAGFRFADGQNCSIAEFNSLVAKTGVTMAGLEWFWTVPR